MGGVAVIIKVGIQPGSSPRCLVPGQADLQEEARRIGRQSPVILPRPETVQNWAPFQGARVHKAANIRFSEWLKDHWHQASWLRLHAGAEIKGTRQPQPCPRAGRPETAIMKTDPLNLLAASCWAGCLVNPI